MRFAWHRPKLNGDMVVPAQKKRTGQNQDMKGTRDVTRGRGVYRSPDRTWSRRRWRTFLGVLSQPAPEPRPSQSPGCDGHFLLHIVNALTSHRSLPRSKEIGFVLSNVTLISMRHFRLKKPSSITSK